MMALPELARKFNRAAERGRGISLSAGDLDLLFSIGVNDLVQSESSKLLRDQCRKRLMKTSIPAGNTVSHGIESVMEASEAHSSRSSGMTSERDASVASLRARQMCRPQKRNSTSSISSESEGKLSARPVASL